MVVEAGSEGAPLRSDARRNRASLLAAARAVFAEQGLNASLEEIARRAGVSIGTLYNRFGRRAELIDAAMAEVVATSVRLTEDALACPDPWQGLVQHLVGYAELQATDRGFTDVCVYSLPAGSGTERAKARGHELFVELMERAKRAGALRADITTTDLGLLVWGVVRATDGVRASAPDAWRRHLAVLLDGLRADAAHELPGEPLDEATVARAMSIS